MKIYFDGGSWCYGSELLDRNKSRYSKIVCDKLGAEEYNISQPGGSNAMMERHLLVDHKNIKEFDLVIIQMVYPDRTEYYDRYKKSLNRMQILVVKIVLSHLVKKLWSRIHMRRLI